MRASGHDRGLTPTEPRPGLRSVLAKPGYRRLWAARTTSQAGDVLQFTALALLIYHLTGSGLGVSGLVLAEIAPVLLLAPLAGLLATTAGFGWAFALNAVSFGVSATLLRCLRSGEASRPVVTASVWTQGREALGLLARDRLLRALAVAQALAALAAGATSALLVVLAARQFHAAGGGYGLMLAGIGAGALIGPLLLTRLSTQARSPRLLFGAFGLRGLVDLVLAAVTALPIAIGALLFYGLGTSTGNVTFSSLIQSHVPAELRGRVFSAFDLIWQSMRLASLLIGGVLGIRAVFYVGGGLLLAAALAGFASPGARSRT